MEISDPFMCRADRDPSQYIADMLLKINEKKKWKDPDSLSDTKRAEQDEEIFQTARLVKYVCAPINFLAALLIIFSLIYH